MAAQQKAVVLLSGGLDSATALAIALQQNYQCYALSFRYGQRHGSELLAAERVAATMRVHQHRIFDLDLSIFDSSALTNTSVAVPTEPAEGIPTTYVPARNTIFLSIAMGWAEVLSAAHIFIGVNAVDYSGYPDCRPEYIQAFQALANLATKAGVEGRRIQIHTPLLDFSKAEIIQRGTQLGVDYAQTVSCYQANSDGAACGQCDSCRLRKQGFAEAGVPDPTRYQ